MVCCYMRRKPCLFTTVGLRIFQNSRPPICMTCNAFTYFLHFHTPETYPKPQNSAKDANANVAPKLSLKATLSSIADLRSIPFTYFCIRDIGTILYPLEARNYIQSAFYSPLLPNEDPNVTHLHPKNQHPKHQR